VTVSTPGGKSNGLAFTVEPPAPASTWYLAEGATAGDFETWVLVQNPGDDPVTIDMDFRVLVQNPGDDPVTIDMDFQTGDGTVQGPREEIPPRSRRTYNLGRYVDTYNVSTLITATGGGVVCERAMYGGNRAWGHDSIGATAPASPP